MNRKLSNEVLEWATDKRHIVVGNSLDIKSVADGSGNRSEVSTGVAVYTEELAGTGARFGPHERWMWLFEDGFIRPLLKANVKVLDRATIVKFSAHSFLTQPSKSNTSVGPKHVEMDALKGYADIFVEILISRSPSSPQGYEFKSTAKEVNTGIILANVTSMTWRGEDQGQRSEYATSHGYEVVDSDALLPVEYVASKLSIDLMNALAETWGK